MNKDYVVMYANHKVSTLKTNHPGTIRVHSPIFSQEMTYSTFMSNAKVIDSNGHKFSPVIRNDGTIEKGIRL